MPVLRKQLFDIAGSEQVHVFQYIAEPV